MLRWAWEYRWQISAVENKNALVLRSARSAWGYQDSNLEPSGYEPPALTVEL